MDPVSGKCVWTEEQLRIPVRRLQEYIEKAQQWTFVPDREKDELTSALGNLEHPGQTRGTPASIPWKVGFPDARGYKCQERRKKVEHSQLQALHERLQGLEEREADRSKRPAEASLEATPPSQRRSSVASTKQTQQLEPVFTAPGSYPVDAITESQHCHLMARWMTLKVKATVGSVLPTEPDTTYHGRSIPEGHARVMVDQITDKFEDLELDHPTGEGEIRLCSSLKAPCLW
nr:transposon protein, putative, CACTA, En/Spm sub-class [Triticum aestivum]